MIEYKVRVADLDGNIVGEFQTFKNLSFNHTLNRISDCSFEISMSDSKAVSNMIQLGKREVWIYRKVSGTYTKIWAGVMTYIGGSLTGDGDMMTIASKGYLSLFQARYTGALREFSSTDAGAIAWTLIDESQTLTDGDFGITEGTIETSVDRDRTYEYKNIYEALVQLAEVNNGFDFEITNAKEFNVYYPYRGDDLSDNQILEWGKNIKEINFIQDFTDPANQVIVLGSGQGEAMETSTRTNTGLRSDYKLRQKIVPYKDVTGQSFLDAKGDKVLAERGKVIREYEVVQIPETSPTYTMLQMGDFVRVRVDNGYLQIDDVVRIIKITVNYEGGMETLRYAFQYLA